MNVSEYDIIFISYDEPKADELYDHLVKVSPRKPLRVLGVTGFDNALKAAAKLSTTSRFITVDGDNMVRPEFFSSTIPDSSAYPADLVYSYNALNTVNGLIYGNGSVKVWPRELVLRLNTHENAMGGGSDFCWTYRYYQVNQIASDVHYAQSPFHAFRGGYREAVKLSLVKDKKLSTWQQTVEQMYQPNLQRLMIWMTVGFDHENGLFSMYGARLGFHDLWLNNLDPNKISSYSWFKENWSNLPEAQSIVEPMCRGVGNTLRSELGIDLPMFYEEASRWFKNVYFNVPREDGLMIPDMKAPE